VDRQGAVWVADTGNDRLQKFDPFGNWLGTYATGGMTMPNGICAGQDFIYVADETSGLIRKFRTNGAYVGQIGVAGTGVGKLANPADVSIDSRGNLYVAEWVDDRVSVWDSTTGAYKYEFGTTGNSAGQLDGPVGIQIDPLDRIWVAESVNDRVQVFMKNGAFVTLFGATGIGNTQFNYPYGLSLNSQSVMVSDLQNDRVKKYTYGEAKTTERVGGKDRYEVAVNLAKKRFPGYVGMKHVIIANGEDRAMADPLGAAQIAGLYDAPVLLTQASILNPRTKAALVAMRAASGPLIIHVVGGTAIVPPAVYNAMAAVNPGGGIERISGSDRYATSVALASRAKTLLSAQGRSTPGVLLFNAESPDAFYDALAASPLAAKSGLVMMGVRKDVLPTSVGNALTLAFAGRPKYVVNSTAYVSADTYSLIGAGARIATLSERTAASKQIAEWGYARGYVKYYHAGIASKIPDALTGGSYIGMMDGALLYTSATSLSSAAAVAADMHDDDIFKGWVFGGPVVVSDAVKNAFNTKIQ
jgi:hypothetical protein